ncbi:MAG: transcription-repair coupling factor [Oscillospiraceae bacterium]|nr:transcription-repair coupling factor [Oscillospiraceae bacterium]
MKQLLNILDEVPEFGQLLANLENGRSPVAVSGLSPVHRAHFAAGLGLRTQRPVVLVCADESEAVRLGEDYTAFTGIQPLLITGREFLFHDGATASRQWEHRRLAAFHRMTTEDVPLIVATIEGLLQRTLPPEELERHVITLDHKGRYDLIELTERLAALGYSRCEQVEGVGQFALRGGILDVFSPAQDYPVRVEFWDEDVDSMGLFDVSSQRRVAQVNRAVFLPVSEVLPVFHEGTWERPGDRLLPTRYDRLATAAHFLPPDALICFSESGRVAERGKNWLWQLGEDVKALIETEKIQGKQAVFAAGMDDLMAFLSDFALCFLDSFATSSTPLPPRAILTVQARQLSCFGISLDTALADLTHYQNAGAGAIVLVGSEQRALNLQAMLRDHKVRSAVDFQLHELPKPGGITIAVGGLTAGFDYVGCPWAVLTEGQSEPRKKGKRLKHAADRRKMDSFTDLSPGDLVVHEHHGIGRFVGLVKMQVDGVQKDYIKLAYAGTDTLYLPATQLDSISKYIGGGEDNENKKLSKLGGGDWERAKKRTKAAVKDLAKGLIQLYAQRQRQPGYAFSPDSPWQREFEDDFPYQETEDQLRSVAEIKRDMETPRPMDRLLCGDVGYGKTEVALRAIMKCVLDGKQAAILVPTTVLARQHYLTARSRFAKYPVEIDVVSRFRTPAQIKSALAGVADGSVDVLIGTHRLLQKDVQFKDLGLLVVDEEQRFGVTHKERLKEITKQVDVLTLSATPIPRTLNMALSGIRDMSAIEEPPAERQPVQTYVMEHNWSVLADAMRRELERGGQIYYLHNRVDTIERTAARIKEMLGEHVEVAVGHGKMSQDELSDVMTRMSDGDVDVLVCTTIIETGIDIANVNTLIIEDADKMGLAQLHQIRGRVGRSPRRAYAYLTYRTGKVLTDIAAKRLGAIREYAEFGSGFKIAMRDLEIRGAGNLLGPEQSGFLMSVGYDLYLKLLEDAVLEEKGEKPARLPECTADLNVSAAIPDRYVPSAEQRMDLYRRIARIRTAEDADDMTDELIDRFGDPPRPVNNLISVALLRAQAARCGITDISQKDANVSLTLTQVDLELISTLAGSFAGRLLFSPGSKPSLTIRLKKGEDPLRMADSVVSRYHALLQEKEAKKANDL